MLTRKTNSGFTLTELIVVVVIIGVLAVISLPNYQKYVIQSKLSESYRILGNIHKNEVAYFYENKEFYDLSNNPATLDVPPTVATDSDWARIGYPASVGTASYFSFKARAGKVDLAGSEVATSTVTGRAFTNLSDDSLVAASYTTPSAVTCNGTTANAATLGAVSQNNYDWIAIAAIGDLRNNMDNLCTAVVLLIDVPGNDTPRSRGGFLVINLGE